MKDLITALGLVLVIEGILYALFPQVVKRMMAMAQEMSPLIFRVGGLAVAALGLVIVWLIRG